MDGRRGGGQAFGGEARHQARHQARQAGQSASKAGVRGGAAGLNRAERGASRDGVAWGSCVSDCGFGREWRA